MLLVKVIYLAFKFSFDALKLSKGFSEVLNLCALMLHFFVFLTEYVTENSILFGLSVQEIHKVLWSSLVILVRTWFCLLLKLQL